MDWYTRSLGECAPWSYLVLVAQTMLVAVLIERALFMFKANLNHEKFLELLTKLVREGNLDRAAKLAAALGMAPIGPVCSAGLAAFDRGPFAVQEAVDLAIAEQEPRIQRRVWRLPVLALVLAAVGVIGSWLLGASFDFSGERSGPLPQGLAMEYAPAMLGLGSGLVGFVLWMAISRSAHKVVVGIYRCRQTLLDLSGQMQQPG
jgi:hypothetical protein